MKNKKTRSVSLLHHRQVLEGLPERTVGCIVEIEGEFWVYVGVTVRHEVPLVELIRLDHPGLSELDYARRILFERFLSLSIVGHIEPQVLKTMPDGLNPDGLAAQGAPCASN